MSKQARSARGQIIDFDVLAIKQQLAKLPVPVGVNLRRRFIDEKDGIKHRQENFIVPPAVVPPIVVGKKAVPAPVVQAEFPSALAVAADAAATSAAAGEKSKHHKKVD